METQLAAFLTYLAAVVQGRKTLASLGWRPGGHGSEARANMGT